MNDDVNDIAEDDDADFSQSAKVFSEQLTASLGADFFSTGLVSSTEKKDEVLERFYRKMAADGVNFVNTY